jgi:meiosis-specific transcription factor NDT80
MWSVFIHSQATVISNVSQPTATSHTFERIQFKNATANNGKRRAQQQYYHLKAELWADIRLDHTRIPVWVKVAHRVSNPVVVRGRSPSHYKNEGPTSQSRASSSSGVGSRPTPQWTGLRGIVGPGPTTSPYPSFGNTSYQPATYPSHGSSLPRFHSTNNDGYGMSSSADHNASSAQYLIALSDPSPMGGSRGLMNSPSGGTIMSTTGHDRVSEEEPSSSGYAYYPGALMEAGLANPKASVKREGPGRPQDSPSGQLQSNYRMVGLETSRGIYNWGGT